MDPTPNIRTTTEMIKPQLEKLDTRSFSSLNTSSSCDIKGATTRIDSITDSATSSVDATERQWSPSLFRLRALSGLAAVAISFCCLFASFGVLAGSDKRPYDDWTFKPTVYLAINTAISNTAIAYGVAQAASISWWHKALQGSTLRELELEWQAGQSFLRAIYHSTKWRRRLNLLTCATLAVALVVIDGPLLQKASSVGPLTISKNVTLTVPVSPEIPRGYGGRAFHSDILEAFTHDQTQVKQWSKNEPITSAAHCDGTCSATVQAPGLEIGRCEKHTWPLGKDILFSNTSTWGGGDLLSSRPLLFATYAPQERFLPSWHNDPESVDAMNQTSGREPDLLIIGSANTWGNWSRGNPDTRQCAGSWTISYCEVFSAVVEHDISITGNTISFPSGTASNRVIARANNTDQDIPPEGINGAPSELGGLLFSINPFILINASLFQPSIDGEFSYANVNSFGGQVGYLTNNSACFINVTDPFSDIVAKTNNVLFRVGVESANISNVLSRIDPGLPVLQTVPAERTHTFSAYHTDFRWFAGAAAIQILTILFVLPNFWGWWRVGVEITLSPFQIARLFNAPMFGEVHSAAGVSGIVDRMGDQKIKLGVVYDKTRRTEFDFSATSKFSRHKARLGFYDPESVEPVRRGTWLTD